MTDTVVVRVDTPQQWQWPIDISRYNRHKKLTDKEYTALVHECSKKYIWYSNPTLIRLMQPMNEVFELINTSGVYASNSEQNPKRAILQQVLKTKTAYWGWTADDWVDCISVANHAFKGKITTAAYLLGRHSDFLLKLQKKVKKIYLQKVASVVFPISEVEHSLLTVQEIIRALGYPDKKRDIINSLLPNALSTILLYCQTPKLEEITDKQFKNLYSQASKTYSDDKRCALSRVSVALKHLGILHQEYSLRPPPGHGSFHNSAEAGVSQEWFDWVERWFKATTLSSSTTKDRRTMLLKIGRWLAQEYPEVTSPEQWDRQLVVNFITAVDNWKVGDFTVSLLTSFQPNFGQTLSAPAKESILLAVRSFLKDLQEWGWISARFNPIQVLRTPRKWQALMGPKPLEKLIESAVWLKLLWAGLNLTEADLKSSGTSGFYYPIELVKAVAIAWLFVGSRNDEYLRLRVGCTRFISTTSDQEAEDIPRPDGPPFPQNVCTMISIPVNKTSKSFTKCVDPIVGAVLQDWEKVRPASQEKIKDRKTEENFHALFSCRGKVIHKKYINDALIPMLCRKAGVPTEDKNGRITSHRARTTIITELGKHGMNAFELARFAGHKGLAQIRHYLAVTPTQLVQSYQKAGVLQKNLRQIQVLIDKDAVESGSAAKGEPWIYYDLGNGWCMNQFWSTCKHRMACGQCSFFRPKGHKEQWLELKNNILKFLQEVPLDDDEVAALEGDVEALEKLVLKHFDEPTPDGRTPHQIKEADGVSQA
ncbi:MAG: site-specific integrase [Chroococcidiopsidaceae cyanobacterium CP_BM_ER_R8_30]|nr:site-specific integrase [Chroococcidiopsidaceae cyanobacterium CP_BM_ER_R8_30]